MKSLTKNLSTIDIARSVWYSGWIEIILFVTVFIMLIVAATYNNVAAARNGDLKSKESYVNNLLIASAVIAALGVMAGVWHIVVSTKLKKLLQGEKK